MTGSRIEQKIVARDVRAKRPVLEVKSATRYGEFKDVSFTLHEGEVLGLTGLLGAGRTELALALFGMTRLDSGEVRIDGDHAALSSNQDAIAAGIAYVSEDRLTLGLNLRQSIADNVSIAVLDRLQNRFGLVAPGRRESQAAEWIAKLTMRAPNVIAAAQTLSGGNQQRIVLAKWLATNPKVLLLDSPTAGVDIGNKQGIYQIIQSLAETGVAILLISDEIAEVYSNCDRVLHMRAGRIVDDFIPGVISENTLSEAVYA
jgi:simple sugar transport system ATP-binding protein